MRDDTASARHRLYLLARVIVARHYRRELTLAVVARALASSPRQLQRAYEQAGQGSFREDLLARRMSVGAQLLIEQRSIPVADVARLVGYSQGSHFAVAFKRRYGLSPARFREAARDAQQRRGRAETGAQGRAAGVRSAALAAPAAAAAAAASSPPSRSMLSSPSVSIASMPGSTSRINVPPSGARSAAMLPPS